DMLTFFRVGQAGLNWAGVSVTALIEDVRETLSHALNGRAVQWKIHQLPQVEGDPAMLRQVVASLIDNALKFTRTKADAVIEIGADKKGDEYVFFVRDNGVGFDQRHADKLFGVFQRLHSPTEFEGTGIGLASVRRIIQRHSGRTWAESTPGEGTTVYFSLPIASRASAHAR